MRRGLAFLGGLVAAGLVARRFNAFGKLGALGYDFQMKFADEAFLGDARTAFLAGARGRVLEVGAGTGANFSHYPTAAALELVAVEPDAAMLDRARRRAVGLGRRVDLRQAGAYPLPFPPESFDTVVFGLCLCTIPDPQAALSEARRVLRPGGQVLFLEHVRSAEPGLAAWQDRLAPAWRVLAGGCHPNRDTRAEFERAGFTFDWIVERVEDRAPIPIVRPGIMGAAKVNLAVGE